MAHDINKGSVFILLVVAALAYPFISVFHGDNATSVQSHPALDEIRVGPPGPMTDFSRAQFGNGWASTGHGCDTRDAILVRDSSDQLGEHPGPLKNGCYPTALHMLSPYRGSVQDGEPLGPEWLDGRRAVQIDHIVPLGWAWRQGAATWPRDVRVKFALDPDNTLAAAAHDNESKSDQGPAEWIPEINQCWYAERWVVVLDRYNLSLNKADRDSLATLLTKCGH